MNLEEDEEITMPGFQEKTVFDLHERRKREKEKLVTNSNADIPSSMLSIRFLGEEAFDEGVASDMYSQFFKYVFRL